jgi:hypothetical protein
MGTRQSSEAMKTTDRFGSCIVERFRREDGGSCFAGFLATYYLAAELIYKSANLSH